ncbi:MAG TPA: VCBS repeat-containing protein [Candidatus Hydrogenedentes bacterium]|nr:VCBS repeat-containing protein [Candidatus Hydrogenedentota bacterium]
MWIVALTLALAAPEANLQFERTRIGDTTYEACSVFDVDNDGELDIVSGEYWFPGPTFTESHKICDVKPQGDYFDDFGDYPMDVNGDGFMDIVSGAWFGQKLTWRENPLGRTVQWKVHDIATVGNIEKPCFWDIDGDGTIDIVPNTPNGPQRIIRLLPQRGKDTQPRFDIHTISEMKTGHGLGFGDINGDGRGDLIIQGGWFEAPEKPFENEWPFHEEPKLYTSSSVPILVLDINGDKLNDLIVGAGHDYGLAWWEQGKDSDGKRTWTLHEIEPKRSQFHEMALADIDNDGELELITGKRWRAHSGGDPGANDPVGVYYYDIDGGDFARHTLDYGPADRNSGTGIYLWITDIDGNGWKDIVAPGKEGMYLFKNMGRNN